MRGIIISVANYERLQVWAEQQGRTMAREGIDRGPGRIEIQVDDEVFTYLSAVDPDPDRALEVLFTTGIGRA